MSKSVKKVNNNKKIDPSLYINSKTGESLSEEIKGLELTTSVESGKVIINSYDYTIVDSTAMNFLRKHLNRSELGSIGIMTEDLKTPLNVVFNHNIPHTNETLQSVLGIASNSTFNLLIKKLMKLGVLYQVKGNVRDKIRVFYMMNPFVARKRKILDSKVTLIFKDFKKNLKNKK